MKILLILPEFETHQRYYKKTRFHFPFSIWYLGSYLKDKGILPELIDLNLMYNTENTVEKKCREYEYIGISFISAQVPRVREICHIIRKANPSAKIIVGGIHPTLFPEQTTASPLVDYLVTGEGELTLVALLTHLDQGLELSSIPELFYKDKQGKVIATDGEKQRVDFENYPPLDYSILDKKMMDSGEKNFLGIITSRGCPYRCTFCVNRAIKEYNRFSFWNVEKTVQEIEKGLTLGFRGMFFWDDNFFANKNRVVRFIQMVKERNLEFEWFAFCRANYFSDSFLNDEILAQLYDIGLRRVSLGGESGSERILKKLCKGITRQQIEYSATSLEKAGIEASYSYMIGLPGEKKEDTLQTLDHLTAMGKILTYPKIVGPLIYCPYPGSDLYKECLEAGWQKPADFEEWSDETNGTTDNPYSLPWIPKDQKNMVNIYWFYSFLIPLSYRKIFNIFHLYCKRTKRDKVLYALLIPIFMLATIGKIRHAIKWYRLPVETFLLKRFRMIIGV